MATLLMIEDSAQQRAAIRRVLEASRVFDRIVEACDGLEGLKQLLAVQPDVVLCDLEMPGIDGQKLLAIKEARAEVAEVPMLFLTAEPSLERRAKLIESGASDTIGKPFHPQELAARLRLHLRIKRLQDELREKNVMLSKLSTTDALTGLRNRRFVDEVLAIEVLRARRYRSVLTILMGDIDHFKAVNDRHGHPAGDAVLRGVSALLRSNLRATDVGGRFGGEEFIVVISHNTPDGAAVLAERWRQAVAHAEFAAPDGTEIGITLSIGIATFDPERHGTAEDLVAEADAALYRAKAAGRNCIAVA